MQSGLITDLHIHLWTLYVLHWAIVNSWGYSSAENTLPDVLKIILSLDISAQTVSVTCVRTDACCIPCFKRNRVHLLLLALLQQAVVWAVNWNITKIIRGARCFLVTAAVLLFFYLKLLQPSASSACLKRSAWWLISQFGLKKCWLFVWCILLKIWGRMYTRFKESHTVGLFEKRHNQLFQHEMVADGGQVLSL